MVADKALLFEQLFGDRLKPEVRDWESDTGPNDVAGAIRRLAPNGARDQKSEP